MTFGRVPKLGGTPQNGWFAFGLLLNTQREFRDALICEKIARMQAKEWFDLYAASTLVFMTLLARYVGAKTTLLRLNLFYRLACQAPKNSRTYVRLEAPL